MSESIEYRLILIWPKTGQILARVENGAATLPRLAVLSGERQVQQLTELVLREWNIRAVALDILPGLNQSPACAVLEVRNSDETSVAMLRAVDLYSIDRTCLSVDECNVVASLLSDDDQHRNVFGRIGWVNQVELWLSEIGRSREVVFIDDIHQLNAGGGFVLARLSTTDGNEYWLKAVGAPNEHEFGITKAIAERMPNYLPPVVAMRDDWKAWITEDSGRTLSESFELPAMRIAVTALARLQRDSVEHRGALRDAGCADCSTPVLEAHLPDITTYLEEAMSNQTSTKVATLEARRIRELEQILREACWRMQDLDIPDTLIHNDINAGNILVSGPRCFFIDWAEGLIGNSFMTFQHICAQIERDGTDAAAWLQEVRSSYRTVWLETLTETQINTAYTLMPILGPLSYLYGNGAWLNSTDRDRPRFQAHVRSLLRYIDRAAQALELEGAISH